MRILQINTTLNWGSTGRIAEEIGLLVNKNGDSSYIAFGRNYTTSQSHPIRIGNKFDFYFHALQTRLFDNHGLSSIKATRKLIREIQDIKPDIIHLHNVHGYYLNYKILFNYLSSTNIPVVWTLHDCWAFTGHCAYYSLADCNRWQKICYNCPQKKSYPASICIDRSRKNFIEKKKVFTSLPNLTLVPVSNWLADEIRKSFFKDYPINVIHNGINLDVFKPIQSPRKEYEKQFIILGVASIWDKRKGLDDFIGLRKMISLDCIIILIGLTNKQVKKLPRGIVGIQRTNSINELVEYYSMANVFFNPTWEDNFPTTNLEAMACGTPVITYKTGGSIEAVDSKTGYVVEQGDLEEVKRIINRMKVEGKQKYIDECRQRAINNYNKDERYEEYIQLYKKILNTSRKTKF